MNNIVFEAGNLETGSGSLQRTLEQVMNELIALDLP